MFVCFHLSKVQKASEGFKFTHSDLLRWNKTTYSTNSKGHQSPNSSKNPGPQSCLPVGGMAAGPAAGGCAGTHPAGTWPHGTCPSWGGPVPWQTGCWTCIPPRRMMSPRQRTPRRRHLLLPCLLVSDLYQPFMAWTVPPSHVTLSTSVCTGKTQKVLGRRDAQESGV